MPALFDASALPSAGESATGAAVARLRGRHDLQRVPAFVRPKCSRGNSCPWQPRLRQRCMRLQSGLTQAAPFSHEFAAADEDEGEPGAEELVKSTSSSSSSSDSAIACGCAFCFGFTLPVATRFAVDLAFGFVGARSADESAAFAIRRRFFGCACRKSKNQIATSHLWSARRRAVRAATAHARTLLANAMFTTNQIALAVQAQIIRGIEQTN